MIINLFGIIEDGKREFGISDAEIFEMGMQKNFKCREEYKLAGYCSSICPEIKHCPNYKP